MRLFILVLFSAIVSSTVAAQESISYDNAKLTLINNVNVASLDPGVAKKVLVKPGQVVAKDDILVELDSDLYASDAKVAKISLDIAKQDAKNDVNLRFAQKSIAVNQKQLQKSQEAVREFAMSISETEIDRLRLERDQSQLSCEQALLEKETAKLTTDLRTEEKASAEIRLKRRMIKSPIAGIVVNVDIQEGEAVSAGQQIVRVINLDRLRIKAVFHKDYALKVQEDSMTYFEIEIDGKVIQLDAEISFVSPEVLPSEKVFEVWAEIDNKERKLLPGFKGKLVVNP